METNSERVAYQAMLRQCEEASYGGDCQDDEQEELEECEQ